MPAKKSATKASSSASSSSAAAAAAPIAPSSVAAPVPSTPARSRAVAKTAANSELGRMRQLGTTLWRQYQQATPQRTKLIDLFLLYLMVVGGLQAVYAVAVVHDPFNAFLSGFGATVGQFVLTASLRIQTSEANKSEFPHTSPERAFVDFVVASLLLHFFCIEGVN